MSHWKLHKSDYQNFLGSSDWTLITEKDFQKDGSGFLPQGDQTVEKLALLLAPNRLSMSTFYMLLAEARRVVPAGGLLALVTKDIPKNLTEQLKSKWQEIVLGEPEGLQPDHYISPEHWETLRTDRKLIRGTPIAFAEFRRTKHNFD